jgi:hypothetical protein
MKQKHRRKVENLTDVEFNIIGRKTVESRKVPFEK